MNEALLSSFVVLVEVTVTLLICGAAAVVLYLRSQRRARTALGALTAKVRASRGERVNRARRILREKLRLADDKSEEIANTVINTENALYKAILTLYARRDNNALVALDDPVQRLVDAYYSLIESSSHALADAGRRTDADAQQLAKLQAKNKVLEDEVKRLKREMKVTVNEYASSFGGGREGAERVLEGGLLTGNELGLGVNLETEEPQTNRDPLPVEKPVEKVEAPPKPAAPTIPPFPAIEAKEHETPEEEHEIASLLASLNIDSFDLGPEEDEGGSADDAA